MAALVQIIDAHTSNVLDNRIKTPIEAYPIGSEVSIFSPTGVGVKSYRVVEVRHSAGQVMVEAHEAHNEYARFRRPARVLRFGGK